MPPTAIRFVPVIFLTQVQKLAQKHGLRGHADFSGSETFGSIRIYKPMKEMKKGETGFSVRFPIANRKSLNTHEVYLDMNPLWVEKFIVDSPDLGIAAGHEAVSQKDITSETMNLFLADVAALFAAETTKLRLLLASTE